LQELFEVIHIKFPSTSSYVVKVNAFGSYSAGLSIFLSDIDVSIIFLDRNDVPLITINTDGEEEVTHEEKGCEEKIKVEEVKRKQNVINVEEVKETVEQEEPLTLTNFSTSFPPLKDKMVPVIPADTVSVSTTALPAATPLPVGSLLDLSKSSLFVVPTCNVSFFI
jgi:predicted nucleotidyltransferase